MEDPMMGMAPEAEAPAAEPNPEEDVDEEDRRMAEF